MCDALAPALAPAPVSAPVSVPPPSVPSTPTMTTHTNTGGGGGGGGVGQRTITLLMHTRMVNPVDAGNELLVNIVDATGTAMGKPRTFAFDTVEPGLLHLQTPCGEVLVKLHSRMASDQLFVELSLLPLSATRTTAEALSATVELEHVQVAACLIR
jgi:hypothetical protein